MFQSQLKVTNRFISTTAWCKRLGRPARRCSAVSGCFSPGRRWSRNCRGSPKKRGPDPENQKWILSSLLYVRWSILAHRTHFNICPLIICTKIFAHLERVPAGGKLLPVVDLEDPLLAVQPLRRRQGSAKNILMIYRISTNQFNMQKLQQFFIAKNIFKNFACQLQEKHIPCTVGSSPHFGLPWCCLLMMGVSKSY